MKCALSRSGWLEAAEASVVITTPWAARSDGGVVGGATTLLMNVSAEGPKGAEEDGAFASALPTVKPSRVSVRILLKRQDSSLRLGIGSEANFS